MENKIHLSAPCRIDMGGTLDITTFNYPLKKYRPSTFNAALDIRTHVYIEPFTKGKIKIFSKGFDPLEYYVQDVVPFSHHLGLVSAICGFFNADGIQIKINSTSPARSSLGGSSVVAVTLTSAFLHLAGEDIYKEETRYKAVSIAHTIESNIAQIPCGVQDQLAAAFGGVNSWLFPSDPLRNFYERREIIKKDKAKEFEERIIVAYCGAPHDSSNINSRWVKGFCQGRDWNKWIEIVKCANDFSEALYHGDYGKVACIMNRETEIRMEITPDVLDKTGLILINSARAFNCGGRFTGAGGGGCVWAVGQKNDIRSLKKQWIKDVRSHENAYILNSKIATMGVKLED